MLNFCKIRERSIVPDGARFSYAAARGEDSRGFGLLAITKRSTYPEADNHLT